MLSKLNSQDVIFGHAEQRDIHMNDILVVLDEKEPRKASQEASVEEIQTILWATSMRITFPQ